MLSREYHFSSRGENVNIKKMRLPLLQNYSSTNTNIKNNLRVLFVYYFFKIYFILLLNLLKIKSFNVFNSS